MWSHFIGIKPPLNQHLIECAALCGAGPVLSFQTICFGTLCYQTQQNANGRPWAMSTPVYYLKISVKILNKMTVCWKKKKRARRRGLDVGSGVSPLACLSIIFLPPPSPPCALAFSVRCPPEGRHRTRWQMLGRKRNKRKQRRTGVEEVEEEEEEEEEVGRERRPCILLLFSLFLPGWAISRPPVFRRLGFW